MIFREGGALGAGIRELLRIKRVARVSTVGEGVAQHQRVATADLVIHFRGGFGLRARRRKEPSRDVPDAQTREGSTRELTIDGLRQERVDIRIALSVLIFLLGGGVVEGAVFDERPAGREPDAIPSQGRLGRLAFERLTAVKGGVLGKDERVAMPLVGAAACDDVDRASGGASVLRRDPVIDHLKLVHNLRRKLSPACAGIFVVVVQPVDGDIVASSPQAAKGKAARGEERLTGQGRPGRRQNSRRQQNKV